MTVLRVGIERWADASGVANIYERGTQARRDLAEQLENSVKWKGRRPFIELLRASLVEDGKLPPKSPAQEVFPLEGTEDPMESRGEEWRDDFEQAMGESFGDCVSPPIPFEDASPHECCEVVWSVAGFDVTPTRLARLSTEQVAELARYFGEYFECKPPTAEQIQSAVTQTLARWPPGSLGEFA